jgi:peptide chain release factor 1
MFNRLDAVEKKYDELNQELMNPETLSDISKTTKISKEISELEETVNCYKEYKNVKKEQEEVKEMLKDKDLAEMAKDEMDRLNNSEEELLEKLEVLLLPKDPNDHKNVIMEIRGAAGGDEANIFAGDLYRMYCKYAEKQGFSVETLNSIDSEAGGFTIVEFMVKGQGAYSKLKYESGSHRVQRVPVTESNGRLQTSTATVLVMPEAEDVDIQIDEKDIKVDVYRSSGCGGQGVNTTDSAVRMTHIPTGIVVTCQNERSQIKNKERALKVLKARIYEAKLKEEEEKTGSERKSKVGTGDRAEKIRTYNYPQNRVTDHRINFTTKQLDRVMEGDLSEIIEALISEDQKRKLANDED